MNKWDRELKNASASYKRDLERCPWIRVIEEKLRQPTQMENKETHANRNRDRRRKKSEI